MFANSSVFIFDASNVISKPAYVANILVFILPAVSGKQDAGFAFSLMMTT